MTTLSIKEENYIRIELLLTGISQRAARAWFDKEFAPFCLSESLKKEYNTLFGLKMTKVITQNQWNLLFPRSPDVPNSATFDVTLITTLLRNLTNLNPPRKGFDCLPRPNETTPGSDLSRIKYYRNYLAHLNDAMLDNDFFTTSWEDISQAIGRLGGESMKQECDLLKTKPLDQSHKEIILEIKHSNEAIDQLKRSLQSLKRSHKEEQRAVKRLKISHRIAVSEIKKGKKDLQRMQNEMVQLATEQDEVIPKNVRDQIKKNIEDWEKKDQMFVSTRASEFAMECLQTNSCLTLTGSAKVGKSFIARHTALLLQKKRYKIVPVNSPTEIRMYYQPGKQTVFIVDDICGNFTANQDQIDTWRQQLPVIKNILEDNNCKIIVSCRLQVYKDDKFNLLPPFKSCECNLVSNKFCLTIKEKIDIAYMYIGSNSRNLNEISKQCEFFPFLCYLYHEKKNVDLNEYFKNPFVIYKNEIEKLIKSCGDEGKHKVCSLVLCVIFNNRLEEKWLQGKVRDQQRQVIKDTCEACRLNRSTSKATLKAALSTLEGTFICKQNGIYRTIHDKLFDFFAQYFGQKMIECFIDHGKEYLIEERFVWQNSLNNQTSNREFTIVITETYLDAYLKRLVNDWSKGMAIFVFNKNDMKVSSFRQRLLHFLLKLDKSKQKELTNTKDTFTARVIRSTASNLQIVLNAVAEYPLITACKLGYTDMVGWILQTNVDVNQRSYDGTTGLSMACQEGHAAIVNMLLEKNVKVNQCNSDGQSSLFKASKKGHSDIVKLLLERNPTVNLCDYYGFTPLIEACLNNNIKIVKLLLQHKADINAQTKDGGNALYFSALAGNLEIAQLLLVNNADSSICIYSQDRWREIFTNHSYNILAKKKYNAMHTLMNYAPLNVQDFVRNKPGHNDIEGSDGNNKMIDYGFGVVAGSSPLHIACFMGRIDIVRCLLDHNVNINMTKDDGTTPLSNACEVGHEDIVKLLLEKSPTVNSCDNNGFTPLLKSCLNNHTSIVKLLLEHKPDINARTLTGANAFYFSALAGNLKVAQLLLVHNADFNISIYSKDHCDIPINSKDCWDDIFIKQSLAFEKKIETYHTLMSNAEQNVQYYLRNKPGHNDEKWSYGYRKMIDYGFGIVAGSSPLHIACFMGWIDIVRCLLDHNANIDMTNEDGATPLSYACELGHTDIVKLLLEKRPNVDSRDSNGFTPLLKSCLNNHTSIFKLLLEHKPDIHARIFTGANALYFSALAGNLEIAHLLLVHKADCNIPIYSKDHWDIPSNSKDCWDYMCTIPSKQSLSFEKKYETYHTLMSNAERNIQDYVRNIPGHYERETSEGYYKMIDYAIEVVAGSSPLHIACFMGRIDIVRCLLDHNANINMTNEDGATPLSYACEVGHEDIVQLLLEIRPNVDSCDNNGFTPLLKSCLNNHTSIVKLLLEHKPDINARPFTGANALYCSVLNGNLEITHLLLENNVDCYVCIHNKECTTGSSADDARISLEQRKLNIFYTLMKTALSNVKKRVRTKSLFYETEELDEFDRASACPYDKSRSIDYVFEVVASSFPLHIACFMGRIDIVHCLLDHNANINMTNENGATPLSYACEIGHEDIVQLLLATNTNVDPCDNDGFTPLIKACFNNNTRSVQLLVINKSDINARTFEGYSALFFSALNGNQKITQLLLENGAKCIICEELIQHAFDNNARKSLVQNQLDIYYNIMTYALSNVKQNIKMKSFGSGDYDRKKSKDYVFNVVAGSSPLHIACFMGWLDVARVLLKHNAEIDMTKKDGTTPLFYACEVGHEDIVRLLLDKGAKTQICRIDEKTPLNIATDNEHESVVLMLNKHAEDQYSAPFELL